MGTVLVAYRYSTSTVPVQVLYKYCIFVEYCPYSSLYWWTSLLTVRLQVQVYFIVHTDIPVLVQYPVDYLCSTRPVLVYCTSTDTLRLESYCSLL